MLRGALVVGLVLLALGCSDDALPAAEESSTGSSAGDTTFSSMSGSAPTTNGEATTTTVGTSMGPGSETTVDPDSSSGSESGTTTGEPIDPFGEAVEIPLALAFDPLALALEDFDGDGALDLLVTGTSGGVVAGATLLGDGAGGFAAPIDAGVTACSAFPIHGAIDDDGAADLFFGTCSTEAIAYTSNGDGTFAPVELLDGWFLPPVRSSRFVDHDGDGDDDLVMLTVDDMGLPQLHLATNDGALPWSVTTSDMVLAGRPGFDPNALGVVRIDDDAGGDVTMIEVGTTLAYARALAPTGHEAPVAVATDIAPSSVGVFDLEDDGLDELLVASRDDEALQLLHNAGDGTFAVDSPLELGDVIPLELALGRFDGDDTHDLAVLDLPTPTIAVYVGLGGGSFELVGPRELPSVAVRLLSGDLGGSAAPDLVAATFANGSITVLLAE